MTRAKQRARGVPRTDTRKDVGAAPEARMGSEVAAIPGWLPPVLYLLVTLWLFRGFVFSSDMLFGGDTLALGYMARAFYAEVLATGAFPRWNPMILGGTPFLESLAGGDALYPPSLLLLHLLEPYRALGWKLVLHVFLAGLFMFGWIRTLGGSRAAAMLAGLGYGSAPFLVSFVAPGHDGKLFVVSLAPLLFTAVERLLSRPGPLPFVGVALVVALVLFTTHFQMAYFLFGGVGTYATFRAAQIWRGTGERTEATAPGYVAADVDTAPRARRRCAALRFGLFLGAAAAGAAAAAVQLVPAVDYVTTDSRRTLTTTTGEAVDHIAWSSSWSLHPEEVMSYVVPEFAGNNAGGSDWAGGTYWGRNGWKDNHEAAGLVVLLLAALSFFGAPRRGVRFFLASLGTVALLFALGQNTPVWRIFYEVVPGISLFRAPSQASFLFGFALVTLAAFGVDRALAMTGPVNGRRRAKAEVEVEDERAMRGLWIAAGVIGLLMLLAASGALFSLWTSVVYPQMTEMQSVILERARPFIIRGFLVATALALATAVVVWAGRSGLLKPSGVVVLLGLLVAIDAVRVNTAFIETFDFREWSAPDPNVQFLLERQGQEAEPFRVASLVRAAQDVTPAMHGIEMATGHHPNDLARFRELIGMEGSGVPFNLIPPEGMNILRLLNVRYYVVPAELGRLPFSIVSQTQRGGQPYENLFEIPTLPRARLVAHAEVIADEWAVPRMLDADFDPEHTALLSERPPVALPGGEAVGEVTWLERTQNRQRLHVASEGPALLIIADNWFPAWRARVDGQEVPVLRAYHTLRAIPVQSGTQEVELFYHSPQLRGSLAITLITLALLAGVAGLALARRPKDGDLLA